MIPILSRGKNWPGSKFQLGKVAAQQARQRQYEPDFIDARTLHSMARTAIRLYITIEKQRAGK
jgi:hypothetical protein